MGRERKRDAKPRTSGAYLWIAFGILAAAAFAGIMVSAATRKVQPPGVGDHWHAEYAVVVCGKTLPPFESGGGIHTHGDGQIHIEPQNSSETGARANLGRFLDGAGMRLTPTSLQLRGGASYRNGEKCPDGNAGTVRLLVNGKPSADWERYALRNRDKILLSFQ